MKYLKYLTSTTAITCSICITLLFLSQACNQGPPEGSRAKQAMRGAEIFKVQCSPCHGMGAVTATVDTLQTPAPDLTKINERWGTSEFPIGAIARFIDGRKEVAAHGPREMPVWGEVYKAEGLNEDEIRGRKGELIAYLMSIQK